jgi:hypothetical protein
MHFEHAVVRELNANLTNQPKSGDYSGMNSSQAAVFKLRTPRAALGLSTLRLLLRP